MQIMAGSLDEKFSYSLEMIVYRHVPSDSLDYREAKALGTILWIIKWSNGFNQVDCFEIVKRAIANYGSAFDFDEKEVAWTIIRLIEKRVLSSVFMGPVRDLSTRSSVIPAIQIVKVNSEALVADALNFNGRHKIVRRSEQSSSSSYLDAPNIRSYNNTLSIRDRFSLNTTNIMMRKMQTGPYSRLDLCKN